MTLLTFLLISINTQHVWLGFQTGHNHFSPLPKCSVVWLEKQTCFQASQVSSTGAKRSRALWCWCARMCWTLTASLVLVGSLTPASTLLALLLMALLPSWVTTSLFSWLVLPKLMVSSFFHVTHFLHTATE